MAALETLKSYGRKDQPTSTMAARRSSSMFRCVGMKIYSVRRVRLHAENVGTFIGCLGEPVVGIERMDLLIRTKSPMPAAPSSVVWY